MALTRRLLAMWLVVAMIAAVNSKREGTITILTEEEDVGVEEETVSTEEHDGGTEEKTVVNKEEGGGRGTEAVDSMEEAKVWNEYVEWWPLKHGFEEAKRSGKNMMLIVCGKGINICTDLKVRVAISGEFAELSKNFVMVYAEHTEVPKDDEMLHPDGHDYIPRILFFRSDGKLRKKIYNSGGHLKFLYFYYNVDSIVQAMKRASSPAYNEREEL